MGEQQLASRCLAGLGGAGQGPQRGFAPVRLRRQFHASADEGGDEIRNDVAVAADDRAVRQLAGDGQGLVDGRTLVEPIVQFDLEVETLGQRLERLDASTRRR